MQRLLVALVYVLFCAIGAAAQPAGAPPGTYNAAVTTTGAFTGDDSLYDSTFGWYCTAQEVLGTIIIFKKITVTSTSTFWGVTGAGLLASQTGPQGPIELVDFRLTVDPPFGSIATSDPVSGWLDNEALVVADFVDRGISIIGDAYWQYDVLLHPADGEGFTLEPGQYYISVRADIKSGSDFFWWRWKDLEGFAEESDIYFHVRKHAPAEFSYVRGRNWSPTEVIENGDMAFDVWMTPEPCDADCNGDAAVDVNDISFVLFRIGYPCEAPDCTSDPNGDGVVDVNDIAYVLFRLGNPC